jgi:hypothetical protein
MKQNTISFDVGGHNCADANRFAASLDELLRREVPGCHVSRQKADQQSLDAGTTIVATIIGSQFALEIARTLHAWLMRNYGSTVRIDGIEATGLAPAQTEKLILKALGRGTPPR